MDLNGTEDRDGGGVRAAQMANPTIGAKQTTLTFRKKPSHLINSPII
jgi:hypothetical protein